MYLVFFLEFILDTLNLYITFFFLFSYLECHMHMDSFSVNKPSSLHVSFFVADYRMDCLEIIFGGDFIAKECVRVFSNLFICCGL